MAKEQKAMYIRSTDLGEMVSTLGQTLDLPELLYALADYAKDGTITEVSPKAKPLFEKIKAHFDHDMPDWPKD